MSLRMLTLGVMLTFAGACNGGTTELNGDDPGADDDTEAVVDEPEWGDIQAIIKRGDDGWDDTDCSSFCDKREDWYDEVYAEYGRMCVRDRTSETCMDMMAILNRITEIHDRDCLDEGGGR